MPERPSDEQVAMWAGVRLAAGHELAGERAAVTLAREVQAWRDKCAEVGVSPDPDVLVQHHRAQGMVIGAANNEAKWLLLLNGGPCPTRMVLTTGDWWLCERCNYSMLSPAVEPAPICPECKDRHEPGVIEQLEELVAHMTGPAEYGYRPLTAVLAKMRVAGET